MPSGEGNTLQFLLGIQLLVGERKHAKQIRRLQENDIMRTCMRYISQVVLAVHIDRSSMDFCFFTPLYRRFRLSHVSRTIDLDEIYRLVSKIFNFMPYGSVLSRFCVLYRFSIDFRYMLDGFQIDFKQMLHTFQIDVRQMLGTFKIHVKQI